VETCDIDITNDTVGYMLDVDGPPQEISWTITIKEIADALAAGGTNPVEKLIIKKILELMKQAGFTIKSGSLVWDYPNGPAIQLATGCDVDAKLNAGWEAKATLKPGTSLTIAFDLDGVTLIVKTSVHADCSFGFGGKVGARIGKKIFGACIRIGKSVGVQMGGDMILDVYHQLALKPNLVQVGGHWQITFTPKVWLNGKLVYFAPTAHADFKIFGIHIKFIEKVIKDTITKQMSRIITPGHVQEELAKLQIAMQTQVDKLFANFHIDLPDMTAQVQPTVANAVRNIVVKQG